MYICVFSSFIFWWTFTLLLCIAYCKVFSSEHSGTFIFSNSDFIFFFSYITWNGIARSHSSYSFLIFWGNFIVFSIRAAPFTVSPHLCQYLLFVVGLTLAILQVWGDTSWFRFTFLSWLLIWGIFSGAYWPAFVKMSIHIFSFLNWVDFF